ncbi:hypothetical protein ABIA35_005309 [Catenulispora sp. MAP12-49]|uniref:STM4015 family protein n=1 Tax=Catenulispora sp. MAP12-49 TaxID=3156302 RepID=UPI0035142746
MSFSHHITEFAGWPVVDFPADPELDTPAEAADPGAVAWRLDCNKDEYFDVDFPELLADFLDRVPSTAVEALVTGQWVEWCEDDCTVVDDLVAVAGRLPSLRALFVNDLVDEQSQPSWIYVPQLTPLLEIFPQLAELWVRGTPDGMVRDDATRPLIAPAKHAALRTLVLQSGGLPASTIRALAECEFPELTHLEIYLGHPRYGGDATIEDLAPLLEAGRFPRLRHLGLKDSMIQDEVAAAVARAPIVAQLESLDLSLGTFGDEGAAALLAGQPLDHLRELDLGHHYLSAPMQSRLRQAWPSVRIGLADEQQEDGWGRYIAVAE